MKAKQREEREREEEEEEEEEEEKSRNVQEVVSDQPCLGSLMKRFSSATLRFTVPIFSTSILKHSSLI